MAATVDQVTKALLTFGLLSADELDALWKEIPADSRPADGVALVQLLVARNLLTSFQAKELLAGRGARLVMGDYVVLEEIGAGGMGRVYKARHRRMNRITALKVMSDAAMKDDAAVKRFQREVRAAALLEHPNIVTAYASGESGNVKYLVMQFVDGGDLSSLVRSGGPLPIDRAVDYVLQAARGLAYAHGEGVIHRDIKPANLLLDKKGVIKILDMGLARIETGDDGLTATEQVMGTVDYMSPEQATNTKTADARADVYSLGCTLWYLLTGKKLYEAESMIARLMAHRDAPLPSLVKTRDDASWPLEQALHRMVAKRADDRFQSMDEVIATLEPFGSAGGASSSAGSGSSIGHGGPRDQKLSAFLKGAGPAVGTAAKPKTPSGTIAASSSPDAGTDPQSRTIAQRPAGFSSPSNPRLTKPPAKKSATMLYAGLGAAAAVLVGVVGWLATRSGETEQIAAAMPVAPVAVAPVAVPKPTAAVPPSSAGSIPIDKLEAANYVWGTPENLGPRVNNVLQNRSPALSNDQLCLIVNTEQAGSDLVEYRRAKVTDLWGPPIYLTGSDYELTPWLSGDGLQLLFASSGFRPSDGFGATDLWMRRRATRTQPWGEPENLGPTINSKFDERGPAVSPDGLSIAFQSNRPGGQGGDDLWMASRPSLAAPFGTPVNLGQRVNTSANEEYPRFLSNDGMVLFVRSAELHMTFRSALGLVGEISLPMNDHKLQAPWLAPDGVTLYFQRESLPTTYGVADVWVMRRVPVNSPEATAPLKSQEELPLPETKAIAFGGHRYQWVPGDMNWYEAKAVAEAMGGHLLAVDSAAEDAWILQTLLADLEIERMVWIGGIKLADRNWTWTDGRPLDFRGWAQGEGNDPGVMAAGAAHRSDGTRGWGDWPPGSRPIAQGSEIRGQSRCVGFVVEWDSPSPTPWQPKFETFNGHRYQLVTKLRDWNAAKAEAETRGGHLLTIETAAERAWVQERFWSAASIVDATQRFYLGGFAEGSDRPWQWLTGEPIDMKLWLGPPPNDTGAGRKVISWQFENVWDDVPPNWRPLPYVIEWDSDR